MLASDVANPEFTGPQNPDASLFVEFYWHEPIDDWKYRTTGEKVKLPRTPFILIQKPGDQTSTIRVAVREDHKRRFPNQWLYFQMKEGMVETKDLPGTPLESWEELKDKPDYLLDLKSKRFFTVESVAMASDSQVQGIGMGGLSLREKAKDFLRNQMNASVKDEIAKRDKQIEELRQMVESLATQVKPDEKRGPGRPKKED